MYPRNAKSLGVSSFLQPILMGALFLTSLQAFGERPLIIYTVNYPLQYFAQRIAGNHAKVVFPVPNNVDPAFWTPAAEHVIEFQRADLILLNGADYAKWIKKVSLPQRRMVNTSAAFKEDYIAIDHGITHTHGPKGEHAHAGTASTTWLDFSLAIEQAKAVRDALVKSGPQYKNEFNDNYKKLEKDLSALDSKLRESITQSVKSQQPLLASHPVYQYMARRCRLNLKSVVWERDVPPTAEQWLELSNLLKDHLASWMIWEKRPGEAVAARLRSLGVDSIVFDPSSSPPEQGNWLSVMQQNIDGMKSAFK